jgi:hypothetical protein
MKRLTLLLFVVIGPTNWWFSRFFETEGIIILTMMVLRYKIEVQEEPQFATETFEERKARILATKAGLTLKCVF